MVTVPYSLDHGKNQERYGSGSGACCLLCAKPITNGTTARWVHVHGGGDVIVTEAEAATMNPVADMGCFPIGPGCLRRHPEIKPYT